MFIENNADTAEPKVVSNISVVVPVAIETVSDSHPFVGYYVMSNPYFYSILRLSTKFNTAAKIGRILLVGCYTMHCCRSIDDQKIKMKEEILTETVISKSKTTL